MEIKDIILEEFTNFMNEAYAMKDSRLEFTQRLTNRSQFNNYQSFTGDFDGKIEESDINIFWGISFWLNDQGIENFVVEIKKVEGTYKLLLLNKQTDKQEQETVKNIDEVDWNFVIDEQTSLMKGGSLYIDSLNFDFANQICRVNFSK